ncbi:unnamed protein product [Spirodela intermedia]|uniref:Uncharacterized protein n=1 Tax=Spirodela intermedia TaxID=51605 RepID=A0A7I8K8T0_SPIIN|nr:unnamed protein product [Spirodela intermedia]
MREAEVKIEGGGVEEGEGEDEAGGGGEGEEAPTHLPFAPSTELSGTSTTVDPSYIISLIRKLLPSNVRPEISSESIHNENTSVEESEVSHPGLCTKDISLSAWGDEMISKIEQLRKIGDSIGVSGHPGPLVVEDVWEDCGCIIWDLAANREHAKFMVDNFLLDVLLMTLSVSKSARVTEICLGIIGNLACHDVLRNAINSTPGLVQTVAEQLTLNDTACLCELCRLLTISLQGEYFISWVEALSPEYVLQRVLWIAENTLNLQLLEKVMELLLAVVSREEVANILLPSLTKLGLSDLFVSLLSCEVSRQRDEHKLERVSVMDLILQSIEVLSTVDHYSQQISSNEQLLKLLSGIVKHPDKDEVGSCCGTSVVIIANILMDVSDLALELFQDIPFFRGLLETLPFVASDPPARGALWSILAQLLLQVKKNTTSPSALQPYSSVLSEKAYLIGDHLDSLSVEDHGEDFNATKLATSQLTQIATTLQGSKSSVDNERVESLLCYCYKFSTFS